MSGDQFTVAVEQQSRIEDTPVNEFGNGTGENPGIRCLGGRAQALRSRAIEWLGGGPRVQCCGITSTGVGP